MCVSEIYGGTCPFQSEFREEKVLDTEYCEKCWHREWREDE